MAPAEVIDLISDSEDDDNLSGKAARSTLNAFQPRKDKQPPKAQGSIRASFAGTQHLTGPSQPQPTQHAPSTQHTPIAPSNQQYAQIAIAPSTKQYAPFAPSTTKYTAIPPRPLQHYKKVVSESSISGILRRGIQSAGRSVGIVSSQPAPASQAAVAQANIRHEILRQESEPPKTYQGRYATPESDVNLRETLAARHSGGPLQKDRQKQFQDFHRKEAERKGVNNLSQGHAPLAPERTAIASSNGQPPQALQSLTPSVNNVQPPVSHERRPYTQANAAFEPAAKRPKLFHSEEAEEALGMREARRLSLASTGMSEPQRNSNDAASFLTKWSAPLVEPSPTAPNSRVGSTTNANSSAPAVVGPTPLRPYHESIPTAMENPPANNDSTANGKGKEKEEGKGKAKAKGKEKAKVKDSQPTSEEFTANFMKDCQQKIVNAAEAAVGTRAERGKPRKPPQPKFKTGEGAKHAKEWQDNIVQTVDKVLGLENFSDTGDDSAPHAIWERPKPGTITAQQLDENDSNSDDSLSNVGPETFGSASKPARPFSGRGEVHSASGTEYTSGSYGPSPDVVPSGPERKNPAQNPSDTDGSPSLFVPERSGSRSPAENAGDGDRPASLFVPGITKSQSPAKNQNDSKSSSPDVVPARSKPAQPPSSSKSIRKTAFVDDYSESESTSPDVVPARSNFKGSAEDPSASDSSSPDAIPAKSKSTRPSFAEGTRNKGLGVDVRSDSDSDSSSPDFVPAVSKPAHHSAKGSMTASAPKANDALKKFLSQPSEPAPDLANTTDKEPQKGADTNANPTNIPQQTKPTTNSRSNHGIPYSKEEDDLLKYLREERKVSWDDMLNHFSGRTRGSLQVRYSTKLKNRQSTMTNHKVSGARVPPLPVHKTTTQQEYAAPARRVPKATTRNDGMVSWGEIKAKSRAIRAVAIADTIEQQVSVETVGSGLDVAVTAPKASIQRLLRSREMGHTGGRNWSSKSRLKVLEGLQNHVLDTLGPRKFFHGASRDVTCVAWANDGNRFAAGAIAIDDERSMQYNRPNNLLLGNNEMNSLKELPEHHVSRPAVTDSNNVNSFHAMQETQDPRLFKTVAAVAFSGDSQALYSAGGDGVVRMYDSSNGKCASSFSQGAEVDLLTANSRGSLASGCHRSDDGSISVLNDQLDPICKLGPSRTDVQSSLPIFPSALKWGSGRYSGLLLAGFASDSYDEDRLAAGEVCLWNLDAENKIELPTVRNVFDVAWNPFPSASASLFAIACTRPGRRFRSSIACFAPNQGRARPVINWDCQAFDINDVVYCPHDDNLIAAGATDGKVYIWDRRFANRSQAPLHIFAHGQTKNVLDHDRDLEIADTGVRFLSWSATSNRLYSGSSDGTVKVWNPYCTTEDALVRNVATFNSAVMSGTFSPDYRDLLIGEDQGQLNLLGIDREERPVRAAKKFDYYPALSPVHATKDNDKLAPARELLASQQIELRPMGALPTRQAVQGPEYQGPYLAPSEEHLQRLVGDHQLALQQQKMVLAGLPHNAETRELINSAQLQVSQTRHAVQQAQLKLDDYKLLAPAASLLQDKFRESRHAWKKDKIINGTKNCRLDCNYLPTAGDDDGEVPDNRRSEQRIPGNLLPPRKVSDAGNMTDSEIAEAGLTSKCIACTGPAAKPKRGLPLCERCSLSRTGLTVRCEDCAAPTRPNFNGGDHPNICERCNFHCFRCGSIAEVSSQGNTITCEPCGTQWEAGALGYEVKRSIKPVVARVRDQESHGHEMESLDQRMVRLFGDDERERLAGGWKVALVDGSVGL